MSLDVQPAPPPPVEKAPLRVHEPPTPIAHRAPATSSRTAHAPLPAARTAVSPPDEAPVDLTGVTLTDPSASAWASAVGNGAAITGPLAAPRAGRAAPSAGPTTDGGPPFVALANLRHRPEPPALTSELEKQYPAEARRDGTPGQALLTARVRPDGTLGRLRILQSTTPAFGEACRRALAPSHWSPPLDRDGRSCATEIRYTCRFEIGM